MSETVLAMEANYATRLVRCSQPGALKSIMAKESEEEWFGYGFIGSDSEPEEIERQFIENVRFAEYWCRHLGLENKRLSLAARLEQLLGELPEECQRAITDEPSALIREIVAARNRFAHGKFDSPRPSFARLLVLSIKLASLLFFSDILHEQGALAAAKISRNSSPYLKKMRGQSDKNPVQL